MRVWLNRNSAWFERRRLFNTLILFAIDLLCVFGQSLELSVPQPLHSSQLTATELISEVGAVCTVLHTQLSWGPDIQKAIDTFTAECFPNPVPIIPDFIVLVATFATHITSVVNKERAASCQCDLYNGTKPEVVLILDAHRKSGIKHSNSLAAAGRALQCVAHSTRCLHHPITNSTESSHLSRTCSSLEQGYT